MSVVNIGGTSCGVKRGRRRGRGLVCDWRRRAGGRAGRCGRATLGMPVRTCWLGQGVSAEKRRDNVAAAGDFTPIWVIVGDRVKPKSEPRARGRRGHLWRL